jgi:hypothetical protein
MADLLGSLLPPGYAAPNVQSVLGGDLADSSCADHGGSPNDNCTPGSSPSATCEAGFNPWGNGSTGCEPGTVPGDELKN